MIKLIKNQTTWIGIIVWATVNVVHTLLLTFNYQISFFTSLADSLIFNTLFTILAAGIWFMTRFSDLRRKSPFEIFITHFSTSAISIIIWINLGKILLENLFFNDTYYLAFLSNSLVIRGISGGLYYLVLASIFYIIITFWEIKEKISRENELNSQLKDAELKMLRSQIRPHFLFNSLNSISSLTLSDPEKAREMVVKLSEFMRFSLGYSEEMLISFDKEMNHERLYLDIEKVRFGEKLLFYENIATSCYHLKIPSMILQPVFENAVKYGVYETTSQNVIHIEATCSESKLKVSITNNFDNDAVFPKGTGTGLKNIAQRLKNIYGAVNLLKVEKTDSLFKVTVEIPQNEND